MLKSVFSPVVAKVYQAHIEFDNDYQFPLLQTDFTDQLNDSIKRQLESSLLNRWTASEHWDFVMDRVKLLLSRIEGGTAASNGLYLNDFKEAFSSVLKSIEDRSVISPRQ
jgi:hypothetical protein